MTKAAQHFGKRLDHFFSNKETRDYMEALYKLPVNPGNIELTQTKTGRNGGTFAHPKLAVFFARWLDIRFAVWCDAMIEDILTKKAEVVVTKPEQSAVVQATIAMPQQFMVAIQQMAQGIMFGQEQLALVQADMAKLEAQVVFHNDQVTIAEFCSQANLKIKKDCHLKLNARLTAEAKKRGFNIRKRQINNYEDKSTTRNTFCFDDLKAIWKDGGYIMKFFIFIPMRLSRHYNGLPRQIRDIYAQVSSSASHLCTISFRC